ncbi:MAG: hypothetical protein IJ781_02420 [Atopobiaceae bacterium]|nr:hypothetical protein [Atopobiaceae bacterium]
MDRVTHARIEGELAQCFAGQREAPSSKVVDDLVFSMLVEDARTAHTSRYGVGLAAFTAAQVRFIPIWTWVTQAALVAVMYLVATASAGTEATRMTVGILSAMTVLVGVPTVHASKRYGVAELEYSCLHNTASVLMARLIVLGCSSALVVACMVGLAVSSLDLGVFEVSLWACLPFFCSCASALAVLRKAPPDAAALLAVVVVAACCSALLLVDVAFSQLYDAASVAVWATAAALALAWLVREVTLTLRSAAAGLDAFSPQMAKTYH